MRFIVLLLALGAASAALARPAPPPTSNCSLSGLDSLAGQLTLDCEIRYSARDAEGRQRATPNTVLLADADPAPRLQVVVGEARTPPPNIGLALRVQINPPTQAATMAAGKEVSMAERGRSNPSRGIEIVGRTSDRP